MELNLLKPASTLELINELASRTGVEKISVEPNRPYEYRGSYMRQRKTLTKGVVLVIPEETAAVTTAHPFGDSDNGVHERTKTSISRPD